MMNFIKSGLLFLSLSASVIFPADVPQTADLISMLPEINIFDLPTEHIQPVAGAAGKIARFCSEVASLLPSARQIDGSAFKCPYCIRYKPTTSTQRLNEHIKSKHPRKPNIACIFCKRELCTQEVADSHACQCTFDSCLYVCSRQNVIKRMEQHIQENHPTSEEETASGCDFGIQPVHSPLPVAAGLALFRNDIAVNLPSGREFSGDDKVFKCFYCTVYKPTNVWKNLNEHIQTRHKKEAKKLCLFCSEELYFREFADTHGCCCPASDCDHRYSCQCVMQRMGDHLQAEHPDFRLSHQSSQRVSSSSASLLLESQQEEAAIAAQRLVLLRNIQPRPLDFGHEQSGASSSSSSLPESQLEQVEIVMQRSALCAADQPCLSRETATSLELFRMAIEKLPVARQADGIFFKCPHCSEYKPTKQLADLNKHMLHKRMSLAHIDKREVLCMFCKEKLWIQERAVTHECQCPICGIKKKHDSVHAMTMHVQNAHPAAALNYDIGLSEPRLKAVSLVNLVKYRNALRLIPSEQRSEDGFYRCPHCYQASTRNFKDMHKHVQLKHGQVYNVPCLFCKEKFYMQGRVGTHECQCPVCGFKKREGLQGGMIEHMQNQHADFVIGGDVVMPIVSSCVTSSSSSSESLSSADAVFVTNAEGKRARAGEDSNQKMKLPRLQLPDEHQRFDEYLHPEISSSTRPLSPPEWEESFLAND